jgi:hypothetical protein
MTTRKTDQSKRGWRLRERFFALRDWMAAPKSERGTQQRKFRWGRASQLAQRKSRRVARDRTRRKTTRRLQHVRRSRGQNVRTGG